MRPCFRFLLPVLGTLLLAAHAQAVTIGFDPATTVASVGDAISVDVVVSDLGGEIVSAYDLDILFDPDVLTLSSVDLLHVLGGTAEASYAAGPAGPGILDLAGVSLLSDADLLALQGGDTVTLATIGFLKTGEGATSLDFVFDAVNDVKGAQAAILAVEPVSGSVEAEAAIPEPSAALTFGVGLLVTGWALRGRGRWRKAIRQTTSTRR